MVSVIHKVQTAQGLPHFVAKNVARTRDSIQRTVHEKRLHQTRIGMQQRQWHIETCICHGIAVVAERFGRFNGTWKHKICSISELHQNKSCTLQSWSSAFAWLLQLVFVPWANFMRFLPESIAENSGSKLDGQEVVTIILWLYSAVKVSFGNNFVSSVTAKNETACHCWSKRQVGWWCVAQTKFRLKECTG